MLFKSVHKNDTITTKLNGSVKEQNISIYFFFSAHHSMVFYF